MLSYSVWRFSKTWMAFRLAWVTLLLWEKLRRSQPLIYASLSATMTISRRGYRGGQWGYIPPLTPTKHYYDHFHFYLFITIDRIHLSSIHECVSIEITKKKQHEVGLHNSKNQLKFAATSDLWNEVNEFSGR